MKYFKTIVYFAGFAAVLLLGVSFGIQNTTTVPLDLLVISLPEHSIALWVLLAFAAGGIILRSYPETKARSRRYRVH